MSGGAGKRTLVIDLDACVGCHACSIACKGWHAARPGTVLADEDAYGPAPFGAFLNRVHSYEVTPAERPAQVVHFPRTCLHCENPPCVPVCPTGASRQRADGIVEIVAERCMGCGLCAWACPYGARELDPVAGTMRKCTLCANRIDDPARSEDERIPACVRACPTGARHFGDITDPDSAVSRLVAERGGYDLMPGFGTQPTSKYLPPRPRDALPTDAPLPKLVPEGGIEHWFDRLLARD
ncbi:4Fe-4S dicluster domain-containing protein [Rhodovulum strictum]|uniref:4Fe-4S dicluster domain-containing protein n=1 Tax=Rhodovulum strictum TaxID=58314 RepID=A0A844B5C2_9RHOB|nr:4Fe-4S dicluster domain-containing protein [Rhodovulum strictum]MRH21401.1 4Fe-4S dicluster domain-containing protein [Rhodovulum strictum]